MRDDTTACWRRKPTLLPRRAANVTWPSSAGPSTSREALLASLRMPACAYDLLALTAVEQLAVRDDLCYHCPPCSSYGQPIGCLSWTGRSSRGNATRSRLLVDAAYVLHDPQNTARRSFQPCQFVRLGVGLVSFVVGFEANTITDEDKACLGGDTAATLSLSEFSRTAKLFAALLDAWQMRHATFLVCTDDVELRWDWLPSLNTALAKIGATKDFRMLQAGAWENMRGTVGLRKGLYRKVAANWPRDRLRRSPGMLMSATGTVFTRKAARHTLRTLPIAASIDATVSDVRLPSGNQSGT